MNKVISYTIVLIILISCQKEESFSPFVWPYWGEASALKNGNIWTPKVIGIQDEKDPTLYGIMLDVYNNDNICKNRLKLTRQPGPK